MTTPITPCIAQSFKPGDKLADCYTLKELLPPQGYFCVWLAKDEELSKDITLHFIPDSVLADGRAMSQLKADVKRNRQIINPRILRVHDLIEGDKWAAVSMDSVKGDSYKAVQEKRGGTPFDPSELGSAIGELCQTLEDAHRVDLFHRDLTPENLLDTPNGLMIQKFGISRVVLDSLARSGAQIDGSRDIAYISPQQLDGERPNRGDDIYSMGASLYELLAGVPPFSGGDVLPQIRKHTPQPVSEKRAALKIAGGTIPKVWDETIAQCLAKLPEQRPKSAAEAGAKFASAKPAASASGPAAAETAAVAGAATAAAGVAAAAAAESSHKLAEPAKTEPKTAEPAQPEQTTKQQKRPWTPGPGKPPVITEATILSTTPVTKAEKAEKAEAKGGAKPDPEKDSKPEVKTEAAKGGTSGGATVGAAKDVAKEPAKEPAKEATKATETSNPPGGAGPTTPTGFPLRAFVDVDGEKRPKTKSSAGIIAGAAVIALIVGLAYLVESNNSSNPAPDSKIATSGTNGGGIAVNNESTPPPAPTDASTPAASATPAPAASPEVAQATPAAEIAQATPAQAAATPSARPAESAPQAPAAPVPIGEPNPTADQLGAMTDAQAQALLADKAKAINNAQAALAADEKAVEEKKAAQAQAADAAQQSQGAIKQGQDNAATAKKAAEDAAATLKQQQDAQQKAQADAEDAQKIAAAKAQAADQAAKSVQAAQAALQQSQTAAQKAQADADQASKAAGDLQKTAADAANGVTQATQVVDQQSKAIAQAQADLTALQQKIQQARNSEAARKAQEEAARKAQEEAARKAAEQAQQLQALQAQRAAETARLAAQAATATKAAQDAQTALAAAQKAVADAERAQREAERQAQAAQSGTAALPMPTAAPQQVVPAASPVPAASAAPATSPAPNTPTLSVHAPGSNMRVDQALNNSLGMRFAPVGKVFFSVWLTRVQDFAAFAKATGYQGSAWQDPGFKQGADHPVVNVSWNDANQFCLWLTAKERAAGILSSNQSYRLPTDLEWSNAVGLTPESGHTPESRDMDVPDVYPWGTAWPPPAGAGNYTGEETDSDVAIKGYNDGFAWTSPVGSFNANKFGLYDMGGNVWEWCGDWWNADQKSKVLRGGSWYNGALKLSLLSSCRIHASADQGTDNYGFRIVLAPEDTKTAAKPKRH